MVELATIFAREHEVHVFANSWDNGFTNIHFHKIPCLTFREFVKAFTFVLPATFMVPKNFDILHSQGLCGFRHDITTAHIIQKTWLRELRKRGSGGRINNFLWSIFGIPLEKIALGPRCSKGVIAISEKVKKDLAIDYGITENVKLIYHGVDLETFHPKNKNLYRSQIRRDFKIPHDVFLGIFVGNLKKGAAAAIQSITNSQNTHLLIVSGSDNHVEKILVHQLGLHSRVHWVPHSIDIHKFFSASDCLIFPTFFDTFGMVIAEAMASGLPVITNKHAGAAELIKHAESGFLTEEPWDIRRISEYLNLLETDPEISLRIGKEARKSIELYTWERCAKDTLEFYKKIVRIKEGPTSKISV